MSLPDAFEGLNELAKARPSGFPDDEDREIIIASYHGANTLEDAVRAVQTMKLAQMKRDDFSSFGQTAKASLSFRTTGVSPAQTASSSAAGLLSLAMFRDLGFGFLFATLVVGLQVLGFLYKGNSTQSLAMGVTGYVGVACFTFGLLSTIKGEIKPKHQRLPDAFSKATWTFSDFRHAEHRPTQGPPSNVLTIAKPRTTTSADKATRKWWTMFLAGGVLGSYVLLYLGIRVAPWWVSLGTLGITWSAAAYRAFTTQNFLLASANGTGSTEHWIGLMRDTVDDSVVATVRYASNRALSLPEQKNKDASSSPSTPSSGERIKSDVKEMASPLGSSFADNSMLLCISALRTSLRTWSCTEDVLKVGLEVARKSCKTRDLALPSVNLDPSLSHPWSGMVRLQLAVYVPGLVWRSNHYLDFALNKDLDFSGLIRSVLQCVHVCLDQEGDLTRHTISPHLAAELSHVLCGPVAHKLLGQPVIVPEEDLGLKDTAAKMTLRTLLNSLDQSYADHEERKYSLQQAMLLPATILACAWDRHHDFHERRQSGLKGPIEDLQSKYMDNLALSGAAHLQAQEKELERLKVWDDFMVQVTDSAPTSSDKDLITPPDQAGPNDQAQHAEPLAMRDDTSGQYSRNQDHADHWLRHDIHNTLEGQGGHTNEARTLLGIGARST